MVQVADGIFHGLGWNRRCVSRCVCSTHLLPFLFFLPLFLFLLVLKMSFTGPIVWVFINYSNSFPYFFVFNCGSPKMMNHGPYKHTS